MFFEITRSDWTDCNRPTVVMFPYSRDLTLATLTAATERATENCSIEHAWCVDFGDAMIGIKECLITNYLKIQSN